MINAIVFIMIAMIAIGGWIYLKIIESDYNNFINKHELTDEEKARQKVFSFNDSNDD